MKTLHRKLLRELWIMRGQALAIALVILCGVATFVMSQVTLDSLQHTRQQFYQNYHFAQIFASLKRAPKPVTERIQAISGVNQVVDRVVAPVNLDVPGFGDPVNGLAVSIPAGQQSALNRLFIRAGRLPAWGADEEVVISEAFAEAHGLQPGDNLFGVINGRRQQLRIVGIALSPEFVYQARPGDLFPDYAHYGILWLGREALAAALDMEGAFNDLLLTLSPGQDSQQVIERLDRILEPYGGQGAYDREQQLSHRYLAQEIEGIEIMATVLPAIFIGVAAFLLNVVTARLIKTQREQIALLKAFGYSNWTVGRYYLTLIALIVLLGSVPGILFGLWLGHGLGRFYIEFFRFPALVFEVRWIVLGLGVLLTSLAVFVGALHAVYGAVKLPPAQAMRPEPPARYRISLLERLGLQRLLSPPGRMIVRNLNRRPLQTLLSLLGIALAVAIMVIGRFQEDAINYMTRIQFTEIQQDDLSVVFTEPVARRALFDLAAERGVIRSEPFRMAAVELRLGHRRYRTQLLGSEPDSRLRRLLDTELRPLPIPPRGLVLSDFIAQQLGATVGDRMRIKMLQERRREVEVTLVAVVQEFTGAAAYMNLSTLNRLMASGDVISGAYLTVDAAQLPRLYPALKEMPAVAGVTIQAESIRRFKETMEETILVFTAVNMLLAGALAFGVVYNSVRIAFSERSHELASLRVLGYSRMEVSYILLGELALLILLALLPGFGLGWLFASGLSAAMASELYRIPVVISHQAYAFAALVVIVSGLASSVLIWRKLTGLSLISALKSRE